jgi:hypothetical protein
VRKISEVEAHDEAGEKAFKKLESKGGLPENWNIQYGPCGNLTNVTLFSIE